ncbi:hypothetical protein [Arcobacter porcinus]|uniref:Putative membrane protein n=1 Tax=Arcobacter porcinus TaxID=1935204 RepID=A0A1C0B1G6_9BACT|nr:hypothetical protein [Arcobacter porcinus]OCL89883.1 hypothetical protein AAX27_01698 [Aliarcobacter thereius]OCL83001.1 hypothetical protein AAW30_01070 [Arcobacter porcinus]OCL84371.1 hypothetical protein AAW29_00035 [Arcobacter porcinus]OCL88911.1 hypothetical protein AAX30_00035 [Arcobacter porcinus]OCL93647.1 hypothetical protein AAX28_01198 [Arcobacter porcinus]
MGLKNYIIATILLMVVVYAFVHSLQLSAYTLTLLGNSWTMPAELWILVPMLFLVLLTYLHMAFYTLVEGFKSRFLKQDIKNMFDLIRTKLIEDDKKVIFKTKEFKELSKVVSNINFDLKSTISNFSNEDLNIAIRTINDINAGAYIKDLKSKQGSKLYEKNIKNRIKNDADFAVEVVKRADKYCYDLQKTALLKVIEDKSLTTVKKAYTYVKLDKELVTAILKKDIATDDFSLGYEEVIRILKDLKLSKEDFVEFAKLYEDSEKPDILILLFEKLSSENEDATDAYLYVLNKFEMKDKLREFLIGSADDEYVAFKALLDLKDAGKLYSLESISYK